MEPLPPLPLSSSPSGGGSPLQLEECIEEVLKLTLISSIQGKLLTGLSNEYCANLLRDDPSDPLPTNNVVPLGFQLNYFAIALSTTGFQVSKWSQSSLFPILKEVDFKLNVQEPFLSQLSDGLKTIEGRCAVGKFKRFQSGHFLLFNKCLMAQVQAVQQYASFHEMLEAEGLSKVLPGVTSIEEGVQFYRSFYSEEKERSNGVLALCLSIPTSQLYVIMASILSGLSYSGVQKLLGFVQTIGTNPESLPPPSSTLLSTFLAPTNPDVKGSTLTNGARALAKHANRSSEGYWGALSGNGIMTRTFCDYEKNKHAMDVIIRLFTQCSWMNMHIVPPHGIVFEIRNDDGYGARWSGDGTKFIGFLEPYMVDGHSNRWKH
ncbi:hypothetical protein Sango_0632700 [Sesamum angolense]|uniref:ASCH domain-containing protein n=1 Tax=Sesamum angolense TaxID=2727404 RepID=A0AAE2C248_9LAMI|nr:hypothetical protein Sango_0632700 [Sesamum angolense]